MLDGDTMVVAGAQARLKGVDASELKSERGEIARAAMIDIIGDSELTCRLTGERTHRREVGYCVTADGVDIVLRLNATGATIVARQVAGTRQSDLEKRL